MNIYEYAKTLDNGISGWDLTEEAKQKAKELGLVVVYGASDDLCEFRGAIDDEVGCFEGGEIYLNRDGIFEACEEDCKWSRLAKEECKIIKAVWHDEGEYCWTYETSIPHATFDILEDGEKYCKGIVFYVENLE